MQQPLVICPLCSDAVDKLVYRFHIESERAVVDKIRKENPSWAENDGLCNRCVDHYRTLVVLQQQVLPEVGPYFPIKSPDDFVILPTPLRLNADARFTGQGVTICFIDSGFYPHEDLTATKNRIKAIVDITNPSRQFSYFQQPHAESWHGTMTTVVCAGDGHASNVLYRGIASDAGLVLLKVQDDEGNISSANLQKALEWVLENYQTYNIRIVNMSVSDDLPVSYHDSRVDQLAEALFSRGVIVVAAIGNDENGAIKPPANAPNVIAVGGINDNNDLDNDAAELYHSTFGLTTDNLMKPELVANAIWVAAPILPATAEKAEAELLHANASAENLKRITATKYFHPSYMHVDGTSFAAPIVSAVLAQLLEIDPSLNGRQLRSILFGTAKRLMNFPVQRQGFGYVQARKAVIRALKNRASISMEQSPDIDAVRKTIAFYLQHECASQICLAGSFNQWEPDVFLMEPGNNGIWKIEIPMLPQGKYAYKFLVDGHTWVEDICNPFREPDGLNGWNSILHVQ